MKTQKNAFTMIELVFVIVVLGILAAIAVPKFTSTRKDALIAKARSDVASIRSGIVTERQGYLIRGLNSYISKGTGDDTVLNNVKRPQIDKGGLFGGVLLYPLKASTGNDGWSSKNSGTYTFKVSGSSNTFTYYPKTGKFLCTSGEECDKLTK
jgi:general secretion pathway protein G